MNEEERRRLELEAEAEAEAEYEYLQQRTQLGGEAPTPQSDGSIIGGASKGYLKGLARAVTAPADLLVRGGNAAIEAMGGDQIENASDFYPSNLVDRAVDWLGGDAAYNQTAETVGKGVGTITGMVAGVPSLTGAVARGTLPQATSLPAVVGAGAKYAPRGLSVVPRTAAIMGAGAAEGALVNTALAAHDPNADLVDEAKQGGVTGALASGVGPVVGEVAGDVGPTLASWGNRAFERSLGATAAAFAKSQKLGGYEVDSMTGDIETQLSKAYQGVRDMGIVPTVGSRATKATIVMDAKNAAGQDIGNIISSIDQAGITPNVTFKNLDNLINNASFATRADLQAQVDTIKKTFQAWDGTAVGLQRGKSDLGKLGYSQAPGVAPAQLSGAVKRAAERDFSDALGSALQEGISTGKIAPDVMERYLAAKQAFGNLAKVSEVVTPLAIKEQQAQIPMWEKAMWTTGGFGVPAMLTYGETKDWKAAVAAGTLGAMTRTSTGRAVQANLFRGGSRAAQTLAELVSNPYMTQLGAVAALPRNWDEIQDDDAAKQTIALRAGMDLLSYNSLPEPAQKAIYEQVAQLDPSGFEAVPGNYNVIDGKFLNPMEKDAYVRDHLSKSPSERAAAIGASFENRFKAPTSPVQTGNRTTPTQGMDFDLKRMAGLIGPLNGNDDSYDGGGDQTIQALLKAKSQHDPVRSGV